MSGDHESEELVAVRRRFLAACGRLGGAPLPAVALMVSISRQNFSVAASGTGEAAGPGRHHGYSHFHNHRRRRHRRQAGTDGLSAWPDQAPTAPVGSRTGT